MNSNGAYRGGYSQRHFDEETGIATYQCLITRDNTFDGQTISIDVDGLSYGSTLLESGDLIMDIDLAEAVAQGETISDPEVDNIEVPFWIK